MCLLDAAKRNTCTGLHGYSEGKVCKCPCALVVAAPLCVRVLEFA